MSLRSALLAVGAAVALTLTHVATPAHADPTPAPEVGYAGPCVTNTDGVTVVIDFQGLGGDPLVRCAPKSPTDGVDAIRSAGFTMQGVRQWGDAFICRINNRPTADETIPMATNPTYKEACVRTPPAAAYWSYWHSPDQGKTWEYSNLGATSYVPKLGEWEGWSFSMNATATTNPEPRTALALQTHADSLLPSDRESVQKAADWIANDWTTRQGSYTNGGGVADSVMALSAAGLRPEAVAGLLTRLKEVGPAYATKNTPGLAKVIIAAQMAGQDPRTFFGCERDLVAELLAAVRASDAGMRSYWGAALFTIALTRAGVEPPAELLTALYSTQAANGSFRSDPDTTGLSISAVKLVELTTSDAAVREAASASLAKAIDWAQNPVNQKKDSAGDYYWATFSPANTTGMLAGALAEAGVDVQSPIKAMKRLQAKTGTGAWSNTLAGTNSNLMATTQAIFAVAHAGYGKGLSTQVAPAAGCSTATPTPTESVTPTVTPSETLTPTTSPTGTVSPTTSAPTTPTPTASASVDLYITPGYHDVNGRRWFTSCAPYSQTQRCRTLIWATTVRQVGGKFVQANGWAFNNLTYKASAKELWRGNPLAMSGEFTSSGRLWRTECGTPATGRDGCRSYAWAAALTNAAAPGQPPTYTWRSGWVFNNIVRFG